MGSLPPFSVKRLNSNSLKNGLACVNESKSGPPISVWNCFHTESGSPPFYLLQASLQAQCRGALSLARPLRGTMYRAPTKGQTREGGAAARPLFVKVDSVFRPRPSSRTSVTKISVSRRYRFSAPSAPESPHAFPFAPPQVLPPYSDRRLFPSRLFAERLAACVVGGHPVAATSNEDQRLLLQMLASGRTSHLRQDLRPTKVRRPPETCEMRQAKDSIADKHQGRRPPIPPPRPRRTRQHTSILSPRLVGHDTSCPFCTEGPPGAAFYRRPPRFFLSPRHYLSPYQVPFVVYYLTRPHQLRKIAPISKSSWRANLGGLDSSPVAAIIRNKARSHDKPLCYSMCRHLSQLRSAVTL